MTTPIIVLAMSDSFPRTSKHLPENFQVIYPAELAEHAANVQAILTTVTVTISADFIAQLPNLKIISCLGTGVDKIDQAALQAKQICLTNTPDLVTNDTADIALALLLCLSRQIVTNDAYARSGAWQVAPSPLTTSLTDKTVGIVGLGRIGKSVAVRAAAFGLRIGYTGTSPKLVPYTFYDDLHTLAEQADFLILCCPGGEATRDLIDLSVLKALGQKGFLINVARGSVVNETDLVYALENNVIAGAGLDVYANEPMIPTALLDMQNVVLLPHVGTATQETREKMLASVLENVCVFFKTGQALTPV